MLCNNILSDSLGVRCPLGSIAITQSCYYFPANPVEDYAEAVTLCSTYDPNSHPVNLETEAEFVSVMDFMEAHNCKPYNVQGEVVYHKIVTDKAKLRIHFHGQHYT